MKEINTLNEYEDIKKRPNSLIEFGMADGCIPCKMTKENLKSFESDNLFDIDYYFCSNIDIIGSLGYSSVPVLEFYTESGKHILDDSSVSMDEDELKNWIKEIK